MELDYENGIYGFKGEYRWLSNFALFETPVKYNDIWFDSAEQLYQAKKCKRREQFILFDGLTAAQSKEFGKQVELRPDWHEIRLQTMFEVQMIKYNQPKFKALLEQTKGLYIEETNWWGDIFFGVCNGVGENNLGKIIMDVRDNHLFKE